jgi:hypothetical protein
MEISTILLQKTINNSKKVVKMSLNILKPEIDLAKKYIRDKIKPEKNVQLNIEKIKKIKQLVKNNYLYIDITNLINDYNFDQYPNLKNIYTTDLLLKTIVYSLIPKNKDGKNRIIYFIFNQKIVVYDVKKENQYILENF